MTTKNNIKALALILLISGVLVASLASVVPVKAQTQDSLFLYTPLGGTVTANGTALTGGSSTKYNNNTSVTLQATASLRLQILSIPICLRIGASTSTSNPFTTKVAAANCALQAIFIPSMHTPSIHNFHWIS